jgi:hypothetical protein
VFVDVADSPDPLSLAAAGVDLARLLWIRCGETGDRGPSLKTPSYFAGVGKETGKTRGVGAETKKPRQIHGWRHPRELMRGVEKAIPSIVGKQTVATEAAQIHVVARCAGEQIERDRENESEVDAILRVKSPLIFADHRQLTHRICKPFGC